ncbi:MAG TPA: fused MFS/spermidine synthase [Agrococcus sp.]|nr:fused MFS/spermidine synthase [Agrococcus sp.]
MRRTLPGGHEARLERDAHGLALVIDGIVQSHIGDPDAPPQHASARWVLAAALAALEGDQDRASGPGTRTDATGAQAGDGSAHTDGSASAQAGDGSARTDGRASAQAGDGLTALHLGGGAVTLPRLLRHRLPRLTQRVVELEPALVELIAEAAPLPDGIDLVVGDGRAALERVAEPVTLVTTDVFGGGRVPPAFTSLEFYRAARAALQPGGMLVVNTVDGPPLRFLRQQLATVRAAFAHVGLVSTGSTLAGARFSNVVLLASDRPLPLDAIRACLRGEQPPVAVLGWRRLERFVADTAPEPVTDATAVGSPDLVRAAYLGPVADGPPALPPSLTEPIGD